MGPGQLQRAAGPALVRLLGPARGRLGRQERGRLAGLCAVDDEVLGPHRRRLRGQAPHPAAASRLPVQRPGRGRGRGRRGRAARQLGESLFPPLFFESAANQNRATKRKRKTHSTLFPLLSPSTSKLLHQAYLDNSSMELYHGRLDKRPGAIAVRIRWYGDGK